MWNKYFVFLGGFLLLFGVQKSTCFGSSNDQQFPLGTIGAIYQLEKLFYGKPVDCGRLLCTLHPTEIRSQKVLNQQSYDIWRTQRLTKIDCPRGEHYEKNRKCIIPEIWKKETVTSLYIVVAGYQSQHACIQLVEQAMWGISLQAVRTCKARFKRELEMDCTKSCLFVEKEFLCGKQSRCIDDYLFGTCAGQGVPENFVYTLTEHDMRKLYKELIKLKADKFTWQDDFTQCIVQNVILSLSLKEPFTKKICQDLLFEFEIETENEIANALEDLLEGELDSELGLPQATFPVSQKRDEIIRVHKYYDKSKAIHKRLMKPSPYDSSYLSYYPKDDLVDLSINDPRFYSGQNYQGGWENSGIPLSDYQMVKNYLEATRGRDLSNNVASDDFTETRHNGLFGGYYGNNDVDDLEPGYQWVDGSDTLEMVPSEDGQMIQENNSEGDLEEEEDSLPPYYANLLDKLINGEIEPENLTDNDLELLLPYVTNMLIKLSDLGNDDDDNGDVIQQNLDQERQLTDAAKEALETEMKLDPNSIPYDTVEEAMNMDEGDDQAEGDLDEVLPLSPDEALAMESNMKSMDENEGDPDQMMVKKLDEMSGVHEAVKKGDVVNTNIVYIQMDHQLTDSDGDKIMEALKKGMKVNPGSLNDYLIEGNTVKINVDSILAGVNAQQVAQQADTNKLDIEKATGYKFLGTGFGDVNTIEYKGADDRYFVLTFVLCGCIAGILLAVVVIYLIKRNTRSKEKLQQIATVQEGNDAASKDYQDLCRQRMQSKSSEKPEPLHAASRVGSVSESQVRSPSSRSSTSSWSEEPVNSNMDISTGHIVLSYMEDHLKNKDRLDREWEAMCAYEADPCSTKVAEDQTNLRKNRYGDVLPYDHSRVVLTTNTNVSGSDYINASSITDHDPRNPAYIATQGPLPHTVADFWQMVWEQGSVVIVMLSKLTENGEGKCHRYWPEEGSDLYHIYEVHLVSEHIWCDDYLVRSFYLKNLQTSETRTVTQFHFLTWPDLGIPGSIKALLDFRRKVNKSYRGRSCPIVVHCSDGCGRTGTYSLVDMVLNRMAKGAKEIDIAATLEHIRDQRMNMVKTKEQFQFALAAVAEEVHAILKALPQ